MSINIQVKNDYSFLFSGIGSSNSTSGTSNFLADYASIKNGSYGKLMKAYYSKDTNDTVKKIASSTTTNGKDEAKDIAKVQSTTDELKESADALLANGSKSLFNKVDITTKDENGVETTTQGYNTDAIYKAVSNFVNDYNSVINAADDVSSSNITNRVNTLKYATAANEKLLNKIGITVNKDKTLSIDEKTFRAADMNTVKSLFNENGSYGYRASAQASLINFAADSEATKASTYNFNGSYANNYNTGNIFNSFF